MSTVVKILTELLKTGYLSLVPTPPPPSVVFHHYFCFMTSYLFKLQTMPTYPIEPERDLTTKLASKRSGRHNPPIFGFQTKPAIGTESLFL